MRRRYAFSLIELLVTVAIIAMLAALLLPSLAGARAEGRRAACLSNLRQLGIATNMYLSDNRDHFWRYSTDVEPGRWDATGGIAWWFGYEPGGPAYNRSNRPLDKSRGALARYLNSTNDGLQCPAFPYESGCYYPKFAARSASYGYNLLLGPANANLPTRRLPEFANRTTSVFVFADGAHFDYNPGMNEGHYIEYSTDLDNPYFGGGFGHFRHRGRAMALFMDGHVDGQPLRGQPFARPACAGPAGNLSSSDGSNRIYGF